MEDREDTTLTNGVKREKKRNKIEKKYNIVQVGSKTTYILIVELKGIYI